jgi:hypothetical protein
MRKLENLVGTFQYKDFKYHVFYEGPYSYTIICKGKEICRSTSITRAREKFMLLIDSGLKIE